MPSGRLVPDVLVIGGGPAGASAAKLLATWGHRVHLVTRPQNESRLAESLPPSCSKLFQTIGVVDAIERAQFIRATGNTVWWGSEVPRVELFADGGRGWQVEADALATVLLDGAVRAGVTVERRGSRPPSLAERELSFGATRTRDEKRPFVLDCSGRTGVLARAHGLREYDEGPRTIALVASWRRDRDWNVPDPTHTIVESYEDGWAWSVPTSSTHRHIAVMVDPQRSGLARGGSGEFGEARGGAARDVYLAEIAKTREFRALVRDAHLDGGPWGWDASTYRARRYAGDDWLLVGDAGAFIDPLSSAGVKKALASGWLAAVVTHTCLTRPEMRSHAIAFFEERETSIQQRFAAMARQMLGDAAVGHTNRFWADRWDENTARPAADDDSAVAAAFERLRRAPSLQVRRSPHLVIEPRAAVSGCEIVLEPRIVEASIPSGTRFVRDVDVVALIELAPQFAEVPEVFEAYCRTSGPVALPDFLRALSTAVARGWLVPFDSR